MKQSIVHIALVVKDYDEAIAFYTEKLHFTLVEDIYQPEQDKRWVVVSPPDSNGTTLLLARASKPEQQPFIGNQTGGRGFLFLNTDDFWRVFRKNVLPKQASMRILCRTIIPDHNKAPCAGFITRSGRHRVNWCV